MGGVEDKWFEDIKAGFEEAYEARRVGKELKALNVSYGVAERAVGKPRFEKYMTEPAMCGHRRWSQLGLALVCLDCGWMEPPVER